MTTTSALSVGDRVKAKVGDGIGSTFAGVIVSIEPNRFGVTYKIRHDLYGLIVDHCDFEVSADPLCLAPNCRDHQTGIFA